MQWEDVLFPGRSWKAGSRQKGVCSTCTITSKHPLALVFTGVSVLKPGATEVFLYIAFNKESH